MTAFDRAATHIPGQPDCVPHGFVGEWIGHSNLCPITKPNGSKYVWPEGTYYNIGTKTKVEWGIPVRLAEIMREMWVNHDHYCHETDKFHRNFVREAIFRFLTNARGNHAIQPALPERSNEQLLLVQDAEAVEAEEVDTRVALHLLCDELAVEAQDVIDYMDRASIYESEQDGDEFIMVEAEDAQRIREHFTRKREEADKQKVLYMFELAQEFGCDEEACARYANGNGWLCLSENDEECVLEKHAEAMREYARVLARAKTQRDVDSYEAGVDHKPAKDSRMTLEEIRRRAAYHAFSQHMAAGRKGDKEEETIWYIRMYELLAIPPQSAE